MCRQFFDCVAKGQAKYIRFCENLKLLDPPKQAQRGRTATMSSTGTNQQNLKKKRGREIDAPNLSANQAHKKVVKYCTIHGRGGHMNNKYEYLKRMVKGLHDKKERNPQSSLANGKLHSQQYSQHELNTIISKIVNAVLKKECSSYA
eukprot:1637974-Ditylum_brightwellii.AAC.1